MLDLMLDALETCEALCDRGLRMTHEPVFISIDVFDRWDRRAVVIRASWYSPAPESR